LLSKSLTFFCKELISPFKELTSFCSECISSSEPEEPELHPGKINAIETTAKNKSCKPFHARNKKAASIGYGAAIA
jgi:hypothetical protein